MINCFLTFLVRVQVCDAYVKVLYIVVFFSLNFSFFSFIIVIRKSYKFLLCKRAIIKLHNSEIHNQEVLYQMYGYSYVISSVCISGIQGLMMVVLHNQNM